MVINLCLSRISVYFLSMELLLAKAMRAVRDLAPLELIYFDLCEMNGELAKGGKRYS